MKAPATSRTTSPHVAATAPGFSRMIEPTISDSRDALSYVEGMVVDGGRWWSEGG